MNTGATNQIIIIAPSNAAFFATMLIARMALSAALKAVLRFALFIGESQDLRSIRKIAFPFTSESELSSRKERNLSLSRADEKSFANISENKAN